MKILKIEDENYPKLLKEIHDPPNLIYLKGRILPSDEKAIAIVGTRKPSYYGKEAARKFASELASLGITIVSGMATGIDTEAHLGALDAGGRTIAVLGTGIDIVYPADNFNLSKKIIENGAVVSELAPGAAGAQWTFPKRNRIISGLSVGIIVIEGGYKSGAMITAKQALDQGREVFAVPGNINSELSHGPHWLIKQGAKLVETIDDILEELQNVLRIPTSAFHEKNSITEKPDASMLTLQEQVIYRELSYSPLHIDEILNKSGLNISTALVLLSQMEIKRFIRQLPGKQFILV